MNHQQLHHACQHAHQQLQINLQTDGKSHVQRAGMFLSLRHGIKVSYGM